MYKYEFLPPNPLHVPRIVPRRHQREYSSYPTHAALKLMFKLLGADHFVLSRGLSHSEKQARDELLGRGL